MPDVLHIGYTTLKYRVKRQWRAATYPASFRNNKLAHRDFQHALIHATKSLGKLAAAVDGWDHERAEPEQAEIPKLLADIVICAERMAQENGIDLGDSLLARLDQLDARWGTSSAPSGVADNRGGTQGEEG